MKCGTTSMYKKLSQHPHVVLPRNKEVRYLMAQKCAAARPAPPSSAMAAAEDDRPRRHDLSLTGTSGTAALGTPEISRLSWTIRVLAPRP